MVAASFGTAEPRVDDCCRAKGVEAAKNTLPAMTVFIFTCAGW